MLIGFVLLLASLSAPSQTFPSRPVRIIVPNPAGGTTDIMVRSMAPRMGEGLGQAVVVENRPGGAGAVAASYVAKQPPDGYTTLAGANSLTIIQTTMARTIDYDLLKDLVPITIGQQGMLVFSTGSAQPFHNAAELIRYAKANPGKLNYASSGVGGSNHIAVELLKSMTGINMVHVPYKGDAPAFAALLSGESQLYLSGIQIYKQFANDGRVRALAVSGSRRSPQLPEVPAMAETVPGFEATYWIGFFTTGGTPKETVARLYREFADGLKVAQVHDLIVNGGAEPGGQTPEEFRRIVAEEVEKWARTIRNASIVVE